MPKFRRVVMLYWKKNGRHDLPWRLTSDPYKIMVSEVMLQQTQVPRVLQKYKEFLKKFPSVRALAKAPLSDVLKVWSGLGYNRRGKYLHDAAKLIVEKHGGKVPQDFAALRALPGMGPYTASAIRVFAFGLPDILIETNVRAVYIHHFFADKKTIDDAQIIPLAHEAATGNPPAGGPREWHWALMDYGVRLKKLHKNPSRRSKHYVRQSRFEGSSRQIRGAILRELSMKRRLVELKRLPFDGSKIESALAALARDRLIVKKRGQWRIA